MNPTEPNQPNMNDFAEQMTEHMVAARKAQEAAYGDKAPPQLFPGAWDFGDGPLGLSRADFIESVRRAEPDWDPERVVLRNWRVLAIYQPDPPGQPDRLLSADLRADDGECLRAGELLYKFYAAAAADLRGSQHRHFEGFDFIGWVVAGVEDAAIYRAFLGS